MQHAAINAYGISAVWRPHGEQRPAMPVSEPFGLNGYTSVAAPASSTYRSGTCPLANTRARTAAFGK